MLVIDEYLMMRVLAGATPPQLSGETDFAIPAYRHYRRLQRVHAPGGGQLSLLLSAGDAEAIRHPDPQLVRVLDPRPLLDDAAQIAGRHAASGLLIAETLAAGVRSGRLAFGRQQNVGRRLAEVARDLAVEVMVIDG